MLMDPNQALAAIRDAFRQYDEALNEAARTVAVSPVADAASDARDAFRALDEWLSADGFLPDAWVAPEDVPETLTVKFGNIDGEPVTYTRV